MISSLLGGEVVEDAREAQRLQREVATKEELAGDLVVLPCALEAGEPERELARLRDIEPDVGIIALRAEVEPREGFATRVVVAQVGIVRPVLPWRILRH